MTTYGFGLLRSLSSSDLTFARLSEFGIGEEHFTEGQEQEAYRFIRNYVAEFGSYPQLETITLHVGNAECFTGLTDEPSEYWVSRIKERWRHRMLSQGITRIQNNMEADGLQNAIASLGHTYLQLRDSYHENRILDLREGERQVMDRHQLLQQATTIPGVSYGIPYLDGVSGGAHPGDAIVIAGPTGVGKTFLSLRVALGAWYSGADVLYTSTEVPPDQLSRRLLGLEGRLNTSSLKRGRLSYFAVQAANQLIDGEVRDNFFKILPGGIYANVDDLLIVAKELGATILIIDGAYMLRIADFRGSRWERMIEVMDRIKQFSMIENMPTIATYQFRKGEHGKVEGIYGGTAMSYIASVMLSFEYERKEDIGDMAPVQHRILKLIKGRDGERGTMRMLYDMLNTRLEQIEVLDGVYDYIDADAEAADTIEEDREMYGEI